MQTKKNKKKSPIRSTTRTIAKARAESRTPKSRKTLINSANTMQGEAHETQQPRQTNRIAEETNTARHSDFPAQSTNQRFPKEPKRRIPKNNPTKNLDKPTSATEPETFKLQKLLAHRGLGSRREMEELIAAGKVMLNDQLAILGDRAGPNDVVRIGRRVIRLNAPEELPRVLLYHKPEGEIVSRDDPQGRPSVFDKLPHLRSSKWIAIGRLDFNTSGLLIFTDDGTFANRLMHPRFEMEREYAVRILGELTDAQMEQLTTGIELDDGTAAFTYLADQGGEGANHWYSVILKEGKNREVRRMFEALGLTVSRLMRVRFGPLNLPPRIKRGQWLELDEKKTRRLLDLIE